jgi:hypothetical protein
MKRASCKILYRTPSQYKSNLQRPKNVKWQFSSWRTSGHNLPAFLGFASGFDFLLEIFDPVAKSSCVCLASHECWRWLCRRYGLRAAKQIEGWLCSSWRLMHQFRKIKKFPHSWSPDNWRGKKESWTATLQKTTNPRAKLVVKPGIILTNTIHKREYIWRDPVTKNSLKGEKINNFEQWENEHITHLTVRNNLCEAAP